MVKKISLKKFFVTWLVLTVVLALGTVLTSKMDTAIPAIWNYIIYGFSFTMLSFFFCPEEK